MRGDVVLKITFKNYSQIALSDTMVFDEQYPEQLQFDEEEKKEVLEGCSVAIWMFVDGELCGECYGTAVSNLDEEIPDVSEFSDAIYCDSTTILPKFQGRGLGKLLKDYYNELAFGAGFRTLIVHATSEAAVKLNIRYAAKFGAVHENWYGTERTAHFYSITI